MEKVVVKGFLWDALSTGEEVGCLSAGCGRLPGGEAVGLSCGDCGVFRGWLAEQEESPQRTGRSCVRAVRSGDRAGLRGDRQAGGVQVAEVVQLGDVEGEIGQ